MVELGSLVLLIRTRARSVEHRISILVSLARHLRARARSWVGHCTLGRVFTVSRRDLLLIRARALGSQDLLLLVTRTVVGGRVGAVGRVDKVFLGDSFLVTTRAVGQHDAHLFVANTVLLGVHGGSGRRVRLVTLGRVDHLAQVFQHFLSLARTSLRLIELDLVSVSQTPFMFLVIGRTVGVVEEVILGHAFLVAARTFRGVDLHLLVSLAEFLLGDGSGRDRTAGGVDPLALGNFLLMGTGAGLLLADLDLQFLVALAV